MLTCLPSNSTAAIGHRMRGLFLVLGLMVGFTHGATAESVPEGVVIKISPPKITRRTFDPQNPPKEMPKLTPPEVGTCVYSFGCTTEVVLRGVTGKFARLSGVEVSTRLSITLWTPEVGPPKILAHEEGHRAICEIYYRDADLIARELAERQIGRQIPVKIRDKDVAQAELRKIQDAIIAEFMRETANRCDHAQARYDAITQHSVDPIPESEAIGRSLAEEATEYARRHSTLPNDLARSSSPALRRSLTRPGG